MSARNAAKRKCEWVECDKRKRFNETGNYFSDELACRNAPHSLERLSALSSTLHYNSNMNDN